MLNPEDLKNNHPLVQIIPYIFGILSLVGVYLGIKTGEEVCRANLYRAFLLAWASFMFPFFASVQTPLGDGLAVAHTTIILFIILPFDLILKSFQSLRGKVTGNVNVNDKSELPKWETEKPTA